MNKCKQVAGIVLVFAMLFSLGACSSKSTDTSSLGGGTAQDGAKGTENGSDGLEGTAAPLMGRFVQGDVTPDGVDIGMAQQLFLQDGAVVFVCYDSQQDISRAFSFTADGVEELDNSALKAFFEDHPDDSEHYGSMDATGGWWPRLSAADGKTRLWHLKDGANPQQVDLTQLETWLAAGDEAYLSSHFSSDGTLATVTVANYTRSDFFWYVVDGKTGEIVNGFKPTVGSDYSPRLRDGVLYSIAQNAVTLFNPLDGGLMESTPLPGSDSTYGFVSYTEDGSVVLVNAKGIHKVQNGGSYLQTIVDNIGFAYASQRAGAMHVLEGPDGSFWLSVQEGDEVRLYRYYLDETLPTQPDTALRVWAMEETLFLRYAVTSYSRQYPDIDVQMEYGRTTGDATLSDEDVIKQLNTRLLAGDVPDVLVLDGLPVDALVTQGMLLDISGLVDTKDYYENILLCYAGQEGAVYAYPTVFQIPVLVSADDADGKADTLELLSSLFADPGEILYDAYGNLFDVLYASYGHRIYPGDGVNEEELRSFLEQTKAMVTAQGITAEEVEFSFSMSSGSETITVDVQPSLNTFYNGYAASGVGIIQGYVDFSSPFHYYEDVRFSALPGGGFIPKLACGIPLNAANTDAAKSFIEVLLTDETLQLDSAVGGLPVRRGLVQREMQRIYDDWQEDAEHNLAMGGTPYKKNPADYDWDALFAAYTSPMPIEAQLEEKLYLQAAALYRGEIDSSTAVANVLRDTALLFAERQ